MKTSLEKMVDQARKRGREIMETETETHAADEQLRAARGLQPTITKKQQRVTASVELHAGDDPHQMQGGYTNEVERTRQRGQAVMDKIKQALKTYPPARQVV